MKTQNVTKFFKHAKTLAVKHSPEILTGIGIAGMFTAIGLAVSETPKALELIEKAKEAKKQTPDDNPKLTKKEVVKVTWKTYMPAAITATTSAACLIGASRVNLKRNAALATAYQLSTAALNEYKEKVVETIGETAEKEIQEKVVKEKIEKAPEKIQTSNVIVAGKDDEVLFYDASFGQLFYSTIENVKSAVNQINYDMLGNQYASLNEFYDELGIDRIDIGESLGWNISRHGMLEVSIADTTVAKNGKPCILLEYHVAPEYNYHKI